MRPYDHLDELAPEQRFQKIAALFATGLRRLHPRTPFPNDLWQQSAANNLPELSLNCLEFHGETRLSGRAG
jgi:hypothetical protein